MRGATGPAGINGATVTSLDKPEEKATTAATPDDAALDDGFYWMFSSLTGRHPFEATAKQYTSQTKQVNVAGDWATTANFRLGAGHLTVTPTSLSTTSVLGGAAKSKTFTVTNDGNAPVDVEFSESAGRLRDADARRQPGEHGPDRRPEGCTAAGIKADVSFAAAPPGRGTPPVRRLRPTSPTRLRGPTSPTTRPR